MGDAATSAGMSYRSAWGLLRRGEGALGQALVVMERGRGTHLSPLGQSMLALDAEARVALGDAHALWASRMQSLMKPKRAKSAQVSSAPLHLFASHDLALADWIENGRWVAGNQIDVIWRGSEEALAALGRGECDIAGFHVPEAWTAAQISVWLRRWLNPQRYQLAPVMRRRQGLLVAPGNPLKLKSLADIAKRGARLVNRQRGSGTRSLIDQLLAANGIDANEIDGYAHEEFTHEAVAATIAGGLADAGLAIEAAAARYELGFVPLITERYSLALRRSVAESDAGRNLLARLNGNTFRQRLNALPGYEPLRVVAVSWKEFVQSA